MNLFSYILKSSCLTLLVLVASTFSQESLADSCGVAAPAPKPQVEGPGLQVTDTCAFPPAVLEPYQVAFPSADGFGNEAMRFPDMQAWISFSQVVQPIAGIGGYTFTTWPTQAQAYSPPSPVAVTMSLADSAKDMAGRFAPHPPRQQLERQKMLQHSKVKGFTLEGTDAPNCRMASNETVHLNPPLVAYLHKANLWNIAGIDAYTSAGKKIVMPQGSVEIKANWVQADAGSAASYITMQDGQGNTWKLLSMHVISKQLPNWTWATFEHKDNTCYGKYLNPQDDFGFPKGATAPSAALTAVFSHYGVNTSVVNNYRLVGAQTDFTDETGRPVVLGNSVTEAGFQTTSSCITCHGRASFDSTGSPQLSIFNPQQQSYNGVLNPSWYFASNGKQINFQTDFMWSMVFCAPKDASSPAACQ